MSTHRVRFLATVVPVPTLARAALGQRYGRANRPRTALHRRPDWPELVCCVVNSCGVGGEGVEDLVGGLGPHEWLRAGCVHPPPGTGRVPAVGADRARPRVAR